MSSPGHAPSSGPSHRGFEIGVAVAIGLFGLLVLIGSLQAGIGWGPEGPRSGFFPFYVAIAILAASAANVVRAWGYPAGRLFAEWSQLGQVAQVVVPTTIYVVVIPFIGIYVASVLLITGFMMRFGSYRSYVALAVAVLTMVAIYLTFEKWFLVPLPKGPIEDWLGL